MGVTVNQTRKQSCVAKIDRLNVARRVSLHLCGGTNFFDFAVFNQHVRGREHIAGARIQQTTSFYQSSRRRRLRGQLSSSKYSDCERKDSAYVHAFVSDEMHQNHYCSRARKNLRNPPACVVASLCLSAGPNWCLSTP